MTLQATLPFVRTRDLLLLLELNRRDAVIAVEGASVAGRIAVEQGRIVDARVGDVTGTAALAPLLAEASGTLRLEPFAEPPARTVDFKGAAELGAAPKGPLSDDEGTIEGDGALPTIAELLELLLLNGRNARVRYEGGELLVARGTLVEAKASGKHGEDALFALLDQAKVAFTAAPEPAALPAPERPLHAALVAVLDQLFDSLALRRKADRDESAALKPILEDLAAGRIHPEVRAALARRLMAGPDVAPLELVTRLCVDPDDAVRAAAKQTVEALDIELLSALVENPATPMPLVAHLIHVFSDDANLLVSAAENPLLDEEVAIQLAELADPNVAQALLHSKVGLLKSVRDALSRDSNTASRRARSQDAIPSTPNPASAPPAATAPAEASPSPSKSKVAKRRSMASLGLRDQILLAGSGNMRQQLALVCSPTQMVACAVITSPRMNDNMAISIAQLPTVNGEALRDLVHARKYSNQYPIARMLAFNPKTPAGAVLELLQRLKDGDLKQLSRTGGTAEMVRTAATRLLASREDKRKFTKH